MITVQNKHITKPLTLPTIPKGSLTMYHSHIIVYKHSLAY